VTADCRSDASTSVDVAWWLLATAYDSIENQCIREREDEAHVVAVQSTQLKHTTKASKQVSR
jgi:hypothetical protein